MFRKNPIFVATAIIVLVLGIGANTAIFSLANTVLLRPLPFPDPERLVLVAQSFKGKQYPWIVSTPANFVYWREQADVLENVAAWRDVSLDYTAGDAVQTVTATAVSESYFRALGATFAVGRAFSQDEDAPNAGSFVVLSHQFWTRQLNGDPEILGKTINLNGVPTTVLGVTARGFDARDLNVGDSNQPDLWVPLQIVSSTTDLMHFLHVLARLKPGVPLQSAQQRLAASTKEYDERFPADHEDGWSFTVVGMREAIVENARPILLLLSGAVGLVLLVACANVANLLLVRALSRDHEIAIRVALGAGRWRVARQLLVESILLALVGGILGVVVGMLGMRWFLSIDAAALPRLAGAATVLALDWHVVAFALGVSIVTALVFGLVPSFVSTRPNLSAIMDSASKRSTGDRRRTSTQSLLVATEVSLAVVLVIGAALLIRTSFALSALDLGLSPDNVLTMRTSFSEPRFQSNTDLARKADNALERVRSIPGVEVAAIAYGVPLQDNMVLPFDIVDRQNAGPATGVTVAVPSSFQYFDALRIQLLEGRKFDERDVRGAPPVVVINQAMADRYWADGSNPMMARIRIASGVIAEAVDEPERQVIGIVGNVRQQGFVSDSEPTMYFPLSQVSNRLTKLMTGTASFAWIVRTATDPRSVSALVQKTVREETGQRVTDVAFMKETWTRSISSQQLSMWLMISFGTVALLLGAVGIYGVMAYSAQQRKQEMAIRIALGAQPGAVRNMVIGEGMRLVVVGVGVGVAASYALANLLASFLFGVKPHDVMVFTAVPSVLAIVALIAVSIPAVHASRVDPTEALRSS
jgi:predicted permease